MRSSLVRRTVVLAAITAAIFCAAPTTASAWKMKTHVYSANLLLEEIGANSGQVEIAPYGWFAVDPEVLSAIQAYPRAYRAGAIGPDGYPDIVIGQACIHPAPKSTTDGTYSDQWLQQQWDNVHNMPPGNARKEALAFVMGCLTHAAGDCFGHDYINGYAGGVFPAVQDAALSLPLQNIIVRHMAAESYVDSKIPAAYTDPASERMKIQAPIDFVVDSLMSNGGIEHGLNPLLGSFTIAPTHLRAMFVLRGWLTDSINGMSKYSPIRWYLEAWRDDVDTGIREWAVHNEEVARGFLTNDLNAAWNALDGWATDHWMKMTPAPDVYCDYVAYTKEISDWVTGHIPYLEDWNNYKRDLIVNSVLVLTLDMTKDDVLAITGDPESFLNGTRHYRSQVMFPAGTVARMDADMGNFGTVPANTADITFAPFHNTIVMAKLALIGQAGTNELLARAGSNLHLTNNPMLGFMRTLDGSDSWENGWRPPAAGTPDWQTTVRSRLYDVRNVWCALFNGFGRGVMNPSFEDEFKGDGVPMDWRYTPGLDHVAGGVVRYTAQTHDGTSAVLLTNIYTSGTPVTRMWTPFVAGLRSVVHASVWVNSGRTESSVRMQVEFLDGNGAIVGTAGVTAQGLGLAEGVWRQMSVVATAPDDAVTGRLALEVGSAAYNAPVIFDDVHFTCTQQCDEPVMDRASGIYPRNEWVRISCPTMAATIRYTTDGSDPTTLSAVFDPEGLPITLTSNVTIKARAWHEEPGWDPSDVVSETYRIGARPPTFLPWPGTYDETQTVDATCAVPGGTIRYTLDGSTPTSASPIWPGPSQVSTATTFRARVFAPDLEPSAVTVGSYQVFSTSVAVSPPGGAFTAYGSRITLACGWPGARIYYSTTGQLPGASSPRWLGTPISISHSMRFRARALLGANSWGPESSYDFLVNTSNPIFSPAAGRYSVPKTVRITYSTPGTRIFYTTDGSDPTTLSAIYTGPIPIASTTTLKARALFGGTTLSPVRTGVFTIAYPAPYFSPIAGRYYTAKYVAIRHVLAGARIFYTTDGSTPTTTSPVYSSPLYLTDATTIKTRALFDDTSWSAIRTGTFDIHLPRPYFSPIGGTYSGARTVAIGYSTRGAIIYYTTDGSEPSRLSARYRAPISITATTTLKARALVGTTWSATKVATFNIRYATPSFTPAGGVYQSARRVTITFPTPGATIYYTTDGSDPIVSSTRYTGPVLVSDSLTLKARALVGASWSPVRSATYTFAFPAPVFVPGSGSYFGPKTVTIIPGTVGAQVYYTTDGSVPDTSSTLYTSAGFSIDETTTMKGRALIGGVTWSAVGEATVNIRYYAPAFSLPAGSYSTTRAVGITMSPSWPGTQIYCTTDGSEPTTASTLYAGPLLIDHTQTLRARALVHGHVWTPEKSATYTINITAPTISPTGGSFTTTKTVTITHPTAGAQIYYTIDGSEPTTASTLYTTRFTIDQTVTVKARARIGGALWSATESVTVGIHYYAPDFTPSSGGPYTRVTTVAITPSTRGAAIHYTTDGSEPTTSSTRYTVPFGLDETTTVKARELINGHVWSATKTVEYKIRYNAPSFSSPGGSYSAGKTITITLTSTGASTLQFHYTLNGSEPTTSSTLYTGPVPLPLGATTTLKARALVNGHVWSATKTATYTIGGAPALAIEAAARRAF